MRRLALILALLLTFPCIAQAQLTLADFTPPDGHGIVMLALLAAESSDYVCAEDDCVSSLLDGSLAIADDLTVNRDIRLEELNRQIRFRRSSTYNGNQQADFRTYFNRTDGVYSDSKIFVQTSLGIVEFPRFDEVGGGYYRHDDVPNDNPPELAGIASGTRVLVAITSANVSTDNCNLYLGGVNLTDPSSMRLGGVTPIRFYLGSTLVCGAAP